MLTLQQQLENALPGGHLHTILDFYAFDRENLTCSYEEVIHCIMEELQAKGEVFGYGSVVTGLALKKESDIDLYLNLCNSPPILYDEVVKRLRRSKCFSGTTPVRNARVPIIRCHHKATGLSIDLNMSNPFGVYNSRFVAELLKCDERLRELFLFLKIWATELGLIGRHGMTSHCLVSMILVSLQVQKLLPSVQQMQSLCPPMIVQGINFAYSLHPPPVVPESMSTRQLIANFFNYYSTLDFGEFVVSPFFGRGVDRCEAQDNFQLDTKHCICVQDPFELNQNLAKSISKTNLHYFRQSLVLAARAYSDQALIWQPKKLYDYLLFGIAKELVAENNHREQPIRIKDPRSQRNEVPIHLLFVPAIIIFLMYYFPFHLLFELLYFFLISLALKF